MFLALKKVGARQYESKPGVGVSTQARPPATSHRRPSQQREGSGACPCHRRPSQQREGSGACPRGFYFRVGFTWVLVIFKATF